MQRFILRFWYAVIAVFIVLLVVAPTTALVGFIVKKVADRQAVIPDVIQTNRDQFIDIDPMPNEDVVSPSNQTTMTLSSGAAFSCTVVYSGQVMCWGANESGQLGFGSDGTALPVGRTANLVASLENVQMVALGLRHSCALVASTGAVWCWGSNTHREIGQYAEGPQTSTSFAQAVAGLDHVTTIAAGDSHTCARKKDGTIWCWGANDHGQLGTGGISLSGGLQNVELPEPSVALFVGANTSCARAQTNALYCWGRGVFGNRTESPVPIPMEVSDLPVDAQFVISTTQICGFSAATPVRCWRTGDQKSYEIPNSQGTALLRALRDGSICGIGKNGVLCWDDAMHIQNIEERGVSDISGGLAFQCIALRAGRLRCRGENTHGQLASSVQSTQNEFITVPLGNSSSLLSAGAGHICGMWQLGALRCWGRAYEGQIGVADLMGTRSHPEPVTPDINGVLAIATGNNHTCALRHDESVRCWGANNAGQLGSGDTLDRAVPQVVVGVQGGVALSAGSDHTCLLERSGSVWCWGDNSEHQAGSGSLLVPFPQHIENLQSVVAIASGGSTNCALQTDALVVCWGAQIGRNPSFEPIAELTDIIAVGVGNRFVCALRIDGSVWCWGVEEGVGATPVPHRVDGLPPIRAIRAGGQHICAIDTVRHLWCWGANQFGQVAPQDTRLFINEPIMRADNVAAVATGFATSCARNVDGTTLCWGDNRYGQLADSDPLVSESPVKGYDDGFSLVAGGNFSCAVLKYVSVRCWGSNEYGQLGDGTTTASAVPQSVRSNEEVVSIAAGSAHACSIVIDGTVRCWGHNNFGQLGNETTEDSSTPVVAAVQSVVQLSLGQSHSCALLQDGGGACWGRNDDGQLGSGNTANSGMPLRVASLSTAIALASGGNHTCALLQNAKVLCWGRDEQGQLGIGTAGPGISVPAEIRGLMGVTALTAGTDHSCALTTEGMVWCWGWNRFGQTGSPAVGEKAFTLVPVKVPDLANVIAVQAGGNHTCALQRNGLVRCWGDNYNGQLGIESTNTNTFDSHGQDIIGLESVIQIATGGAHTCVLQQRGNVRCWGWNRDGQLGNGSRTQLTDVYAPIPIVGQSHVSSLALGEGHLCDVDTVGTVWCWGDNDVGQLGIGIMGNVGDLGLPNEVDAAVNTVSVELGAGHSCALLVTAELNCWGRNNFGQLGNSYAGDIADSVVPNFVVGLTNVSAYSAGGDTSCAVSAGIVSCWGDNQYGQLGTATVGVGDYRTTATVVSGIDAVIDVTVGTHHVCALRQDRSVWCWGRNNAHQVNESSADIVVAPTRSALQNPIAAIGSSADHTCAVDTVGGVWCWGNNQSGQLSVVGESIKTIQHVEGIPAARSVVTGSQHSCALDATNTVWCWGNNEHGQLGSPRTEPPTLVPPTLVTGLKKVQSIAAAGARTCAVIENGEAWCWGENASGQLGVSPNPDRHAPALVQQLWSMRVSTFIPLIPTALPLLPTTHPTETSIPTKTTIPTRTLIRTHP